MKVCTLLFIGVAVFLVSLTFNIQFKNQNNLLTKLSFFQIANVCANEGEASAKSEAEASGKDAKAAANSHAEVKDGKAAAGGKAEASGDKAKASTEAKAEGGEPPKPKGKGKGKKKPPPPEDC